MSDDLKQHIHSNHDFYALLEVESAATQEQIRRGYRQTARKYHPDKVGASQSNLDKFHLLQIAYDVLSDASVKELYDNARRAREEKKEREAKLHGKRKAMIDALERKEADAKKPRHEEPSEDGQFDMRQYTEIMERHIRGFNEKRRQEAEHVAAQAQKAESNPAQSTDEDADRCISVRYRKTDATSQWDTDKIKSLFSRFGKIENVITRQTKKKPPGEKHKQDYFVAVIEYASILAAHAAVIADMDVLENDLRTVESVTWAAGKDPEGLSKGTASASIHQSMQDERSQSGAAPKFSFNAKQNDNRSVSTPDGKNSSWNDMMNRLKEADRRRSTAPKG